MNRYASAWLSLWVLLILVVTGCAKTRLTRVQDPDYSGRSFGAPAVLAETADLQRRQLLEEALVTELGQHGINAKASMQLLPPTRDYTPQERLGVLQHSSIDSLIVVTGESGVTREYVPVTGSTTNTTGTAQLYGNQATYQAQSNTTYQGGYYVEKPWSKVTTTLIDLSNGRAAWIGSSETGGNAWASFDDVHKSYSKAVVARIVGDGLFTSHPTASLPMEPIAASSPAVNSRPADPSAKEGLPAAAESHASVTLDTFSTFEFFSESGTFEVYELAGGLVKREPDNASFREGGSRFSITGEDRGMMFGNLGASDIEVRRTERSLSFIERSPTGAFLHVLTIENHWRSDVRGFAASYVRAVEPNAMTGGRRLVSTFSGYARPIARPSSSP